MSDKIDPTRELLTEHFGLVADNSHAHYLVRARLVVDVAAGVPADREPLSRVSNELRDFYRESMAEVIDAGTVHLRAAWRADRSRRMAAGENLAHAPGYRAWDDSPQEALQMVARELLACAVDVQPWDDIARDLLASDHDGQTLADIAACLRELRTIEDAKHGTDPVAGEVPVGVLAERLAIDSGTLAARLEVLRRLGLAATRYVGGTSGALAASVDWAPVSTYVPDRVTLEG